jgi:serine/threonine-protein kinase HipA
VKSFEESVEIAMDGSDKELFRNYVKKQVFEMDMHLKNFSLIKKPDAGWTLCPAYDMVPSALVMKDDPEELALNINGKKRKIKINDFISVMENCRIPPKAIENIFKRFEGVELKWNEIIRHSFISDAMKEAYSRLIAERINKLNLNRS